MTTVPYRFAEKVPCQLIEEAACQLIKKVACHPDHGYVHPANGCVILSEVWRDFAPDGVEEPVLSLSKESAVSSADLCRQFSEQQTSKDRPVHSRRLSFGPKTQPIPAWGNAPGTETATNPRAEGPLDTSLGQRPRYACNRLWRAEGPIYLRREGGLR
jgi:hypothetical protein